MKLKILNLLFISFVIFTVSCSRITIIDSFQKKSIEVDKFNYLGQNRNGYIELKSGESIHTRTLNLKKDTLEFISINSDSLKSINPYKIKLVYFEDYFVGAFDGFWLGTLVTGIIMAILVEYGSGEPTGEIVYLLAGGSIVGTSTGALIGSELKYKFIPNNNQNIETK